jgi:hypothetical protein
LISNFRRVLNVAFFLLGDSPASEFYVPTFRDTQGNEDGTECSEWIYLQKHKNMYATNHQKIINNADATKVDTDSWDFNPRTGHTA